MDAVLNGDEVMFVLEEGCAIVLDIRDAESCWCSFMIFWDIIDTIGVI